MYENGTSGTVAPLPSDATLQSDAFGEMKSGSHEGLAWLVSAAERVVSLHVEQVADALSRTSSERLYELLEQSRRRTHARIRG